ncbi:MAG: hypothetical protein ACE5MM_05800 [Nitrospiraceae bacterium]
MKSHIVRFACYLGLTILSACAATGEVVMLDLHAVPLAGEANMQESDGIRVAVLPFEDARSETGPLGMRAHLWGGVSFFEIEGGEPGAVVARVVADYLQHQGWRAETEESLLVAGLAFNGQPDVELSGSVFAFSVNATSTIGSTEIKVATKLNVEAENISDGSIVRMTLNGTGSYTNIFWYEPEDAQRLLSDVLSESIGKLVDDTRVEGNLLRLK